MGRHRRSAPHAPERPRTGPVDGPTDVAAPAGHRGHRAARRTAPVRTGLLGASAAVAMGAVAVASGLVPGGGRFEVGGGRADRVRADVLPDARPQESSTAPAPAPTDVAGRGEGTGASRGAGRAPSTTAPPSPGATPSASRTAAPTPTPPSPVTGGRPSAQPTGGPTTTAPRPTATPTAGPTAAPTAGGGTEAAAEAEVVSLVNQERARAGCSPVTASRELAGLAERFSDDMARRGFFGHTDPDGHTPWDRARDQGIADLGGENIARGQSDARAVMASWMDDPEHRANILNCEYKALGVGAHFGPGGPWWAQEFGF
ncbi:CAP domain-containing protein [Streptomyces yunnanensis]|uniref:CAP domain-containing protein n=1 Tax=Streptomyces yunnanensis TaxID=156453 RepID=UPI003B83065F